MRSSSSSEMFGLPSIFIGMCSALAMRPSPLWLVTSDARAVFSAFSASTTAASSLSPTVVDRPDFAARGDQFGNQLRHFENGGIDRPLGGVQFVDHTLRNKGLVHKSLSKPVRLS